MADMQSEAEIDAMEEEFIDRFGPLQDEVAGLLFQMRVRVRAELAGLASIAVEGEQLVLRFPPLPEGVTTRNLPNIVTGPLREKCLLDARRVRRTRDGGRA